MYSIGLLFIIRALSVLYQLVTKDVAGPILFQIESLFTLLRSIIMTLLLSHCVCVCVFVCPGYMYFLLCIANSY